MIEPIYEPHSSVVYDARFTPGRFILAVNTLSFLISAEDNLNCKLSLTGDNINKCVTQIISVGFQGRK